MYGDEILYEILVFRTYLDISDVDEQVDSTEGTFNLSDLFIGAIRLSHLAYNTTFIMRLAPDIMLLG